MKKDFDYQINLSNLKDKKNKIYTFSFDKSLFEYFKIDEPSDGKGKVTAFVEKRNKRSTQSPITVKLHIKGFIKVCCDRSLKEFNLPLDLTEIIFFEWAEKAEDLDINFFKIPFGQQNVDLSQLVYDIIISSIPIKKLHPDFEETEHEEDSKIVYISKD